MSIDTGRAQSLSAADISGWVHFTDVQWDSDGQTLVWRQQKGSRGTLVAQRRGGDTCDLTPGISVRAEVNYGGGDFTVAHRHVLYVCDGILWRKKIEGGNAVQVTGEAGSVAAPAVSADGNWVAYVRSGVDSDEVRVVAWRDRDAEMCLLAGDEFYMQPSWHPSGSMFACVAWNAPQMPWDGSELRLAHLYFADGMLHVERLQTVAGGSGTAVFQPEFSPDGSYLAYVSDENGWGHMYVQNLITGTVRQLTDGDADHARPAWVQGLRTFAWARDSDAVFALRNERGRVRMWRYGVDGSNNEVKAMADYTEFTAITAASDDDTIACVASASTVPSELVTLSLNSDFGPQVIARGRDEVLPIGSLSKAQMVQWYSACDEPVYGLYYPPAVSNAEKPPAIVMSHGGPTAQRSLDFYPEVQFFVSRGYAVLQVNYRGSSGFGREYMLRMRGEWGKVDREDLLSGARFLVDSELADGERLVAMGNSAGSVSVLLALIHMPDIFAAGVCCYSVTDMLALSAETHRFERHYSETLLGRLPAAAATYRRRSALMRADEIVVPLLLFHGEDDAVVAPEQSEGIAVSMKRRGVPHEYYLFEGEGHGWRKQETIVAYYAATERFLRRYL